MLVKRNQTIPYVGEIVVFSRKVQPYLQQWVVAAEIGVSSAAAAALCELMAELLNKF
jgi:hypothetical protein